MKEILSCKRICSMAIAILLIVLSSSCVLADVQSLPPEYVSLVYLPTPLSSASPTYSLTVKFSPSHSTITAGQKATSTAYYDNKGKSAFVVTGCIMTIKYKGKTQGISCTESTATIKAKTTYDQEWQVSTSSSTLLGTYVFTLILTGTVNGVAMQSKPGSWTVTVKG